MSLGSSSFCRGNSKEPDFPLSLARGVEMGSGIHVPRIAIPLPVTNERLFSVSPAAVLNQGWEASLDAKLARLCGFGDTWHQWGTKALALARLCVFVSEVRMIFLSRVLGQRW